MAGLSEDDLKRIEEFVEAPSRKRRPEILCPETGDDVHARESRSGPG